jgi:hypothetical protein
LGVVPTTEVLTFIKEHESAWVVSTAFIARSTLLTGTPPNIR